MALSAGTVGQDKEIKIAVTLQDYDAFMGVYDPLKSLQEFIQEVCHFWNLPDPSQYMVQFADIPPHHYVSDANKHRIKSGQLMNLVTAAPLLCTSIISSLVRANQQNRASAITDLNKFATDPAFVYYFIDQQGLETVMPLLISLPQDDPCLSPLLQAFSDLINTGRAITDTVHWEICGDAFVDKMVLLVDTRTPVPEALVLQTLVVLRNIVCNSLTRHAIVDKTLNLLRLMQHLNTAKDPATRCAVLALLTALIERADEGRRQDYVAKLSDRKYRAYITDNVLASNNLLDEGCLSPGLRRQLHRLQRLLLNQLQRRLLVGVAPDDSRAAEKILELRNVAFEADAELSGGSSERREEIKKEYKKLGFKNDNPAQDFNEVPPGVLALDNIFYFCHNRPEQYSKLVLENCYRADSHECPIGKASIELTKQLAKILKIGELPLDDSEDFHPMLFTNDHPFEELFCICITLLNKTWKEMKATTEDFSKVMSVVKEQISRALQHKPTNLDQFHKRLQELTYERITEYWNRERMNIEQKEMKAPQILKLKEELRRDIREVVEQQRLRILEEGARFRNPAKKGKYFFCRLSPNHKFFHYHECDEKAVSVPPLDDLSKKISVSDIKSIATGKECPHHNTRRKNQYAFSLMLESGKTEAVSLDFVVLEEETFNIWHDGVKVLLRENMCSDASVRDITMLLDMEIKLQLLDVEGVTIPSDLPPVPPLPPNYNFCYNL